MADPWKHHIIHQLKLRDRTQKIMFQEVIRSYVTLLEKSNQRILIAQGILGSAARVPSYTSKESIVSEDENKVKDLKKTNGELAYKVVELQQEITIKASILDEQYTKMSELKKQLEAAECRFGKLQAEVVEVRDGNSRLKQEYDALLRQHHTMDEKYREEKMRGTELLEDMIRQKQLAAARMNSRNEKRVRARVAGIQKTVAKEKVQECVGPSDTLPTATAPPKAKMDEQPKKTHPRPFSKKRRGNSVCSLEEDFCAPMRVCLVARVPCRSLHVLDAHEQGINAVRFSSSSNLLATGGTDRVIKLWDISAGTLQNRGTLDGSNEGITSIEFDPTGTKILAASYDKSALFWRLDSCSPKFTLTGHSRKVTAAKFKCSLRQVVTGSADRTVKVWDLQRAACIQTIEVISYCSDVVCTEYFIISGHYDRKIRFWDSRAASCTQEIPLQDRVTSMDLCPDHRQLLSCSRDESLQVVDIRMSSSRRSFRADGFKCGSDNTKAIFSPDGSYLAAGSADGAVYIWNVNTGNLETCLPDKHNSSINAVSWSVSGEYVVSVDKSRRAVLWSDI
ncbi:protein Atg16l2-like isoform X2 [Paramormyrops kingsleyae]|uniref:Protein Atg16l2 n=1 Tax=Paramormyrops kingsleyae TaxID=1676925 RepID=A0A3B3SN40_9TELE|nr:autophagy-related protein 16-2-like isoform X2 [Paramormyrops kingsleyae]